jgi:HK97 family phage portal protein
VGVLERVNARHAETRAIGGVPWRPWDSPWTRFDVGGPVHPSRAGYGGQEGALRLAPLYSAVRLIAEGVAKLPVKQYRDAGDRTVRLPPGQLLAKPSAYLRPFDWKLTGMTSVLLHGMAYGLITARDGYGYPTSVEWLPPQLVSVEDSEPFNPAKAQFFYAGRTVNRENLFIIRGLSVAGQTKAVSPLQAFQMLIEAGHDALAYGTGWYKSGGFPPGTFRNTQYEVDDEQSNKIRRKLVAAQRAREPLVFGRDWEYTPITVPPEQAQFIESQRLTATQIAGIYGVAPERIGGSKGDSMTYSNAEADQIAFITDTLDPWLIRFEEGYGEALPSAQYASFDRDARIRHDITTRWNVYRTARDIGGLNVNEIRDLEEREPLPKPKDDNDYDGTDFTPLQIQVAAARGTKEILGEGGTETPPVAAAAPQRVPAAKPGQPVPQGQVPPKVPAMNGASRNGKQRGPGAGS